VGEVWVHGPTVARGYLAAPTATAASFSGGWFRTGDLGLLDADGYLFITGRIKNIINRGGEKISPEHIEAVLARCCRSELAPFEVPDRIDIVAALPHTAKGALDRRAVQNQYAHPADIS
jgi:acyl-CoA synthetase (AMP-forming)/AMP-acid ligase II